MLNVNYPQGIPNYLEGDLFLKSSPPSNGRFLKILILMNIFKRLRKHIAGHEEADVWHDVQQWNLQFATFSGSLRHDEEWYWEKHLSKLLAIHDFQITPREHPRIPSEVYYNKSNFFLYPKLDYLWVYILWSWLIFGPGCCFYLGGSHCNPFDLSLFSFRGFTAGNLFLFLLNPRKIFFFFSFSACVEKLVIL